ncbi:MAG: GNAT family N-acetyltransferase [Planctomycetota bacterium]
MTPEGSVRVRPLRSPRRFLDLQRAFYRGDPDFVPPMTIGEAWQVDPRRNPFFEHAEAEFLVALRGSRPVGRISAVRDRLHDEFTGTKIGFFGHFEAEDGAAAHALLAEAARWCADRGADALRGPIDLSTNYKCGLLIEGRGAPVLMMPYNPPCYAEWIESFGMRKAKDLLAFFGSEKTLDLDRVRKLVLRLSKKSGTRLRPVDLRHLDREIDVLVSLYNRIWERNWGFVPMSEAEFRRQAEDLKRIAHPSLLHIAEAGGEPVGFIVALPDVNQAIRACGGRILPFGWLKFLRAMKRVHTVRVITLGVVPEHRRLGVEMQLIHGVVENGLAAGFDASEASWILEDNREMIQPLMTLGYEPYRRYRIYEKALP